MQTGGPLPISGINGSAPASPYATGTISYDAKMFQKKFPGMEEGNIFGLGGMLMYDKAMGGVVKSTYASLNISYRVKLSSGETKHRLGAGFGGYLWSPAY